MDKNLKLLAVAGGALVVVACQSPTPRNPSLDHARRVYQLTRGDPWVAEHAALQLTQARQSLRAAERQWSNGGDDVTTRALARLALRQVEMARTMAGNADDVDRDKSVPPLLEASQRSGSGSDTRLPTLPARPSHAQAQQVRLAPAR